jgi:magnesium transporter
VSAAVQLSEPAEQLLRSVVDRFLKERPVEAARQLETVGAKRAAAVLGKRPAAIAAEVLRRLNPDEGARVLAELEAPLARAVLLVLDPTNAANLLARLGEEQKTAALASLPDRTRTELAEMLEYPPGTAGHEMDASVTAFSPDSSVERALELIRTLPNRRISDVMLTDDDGKLYGSVSLQDLVGAAPDQKLETLARRDVPFARPMTRRDEVVDLLTQHKLTSLPVVDHDGKLIGILRHAALVEAAQQDAAGDLQQMVGVSREEGALSSPWLAIRTRLPWLNVNLVTAFAASAVIGLFEDTIARFTALAVLMPVVAGQSGNTGAQALAVTMRGLALREIRPSHWPRVLRKEAVVGATNGIAIALVTGLGVLLWSRSLALGAVISIAMVLSMCIASLAGASIPVILVLLKRDPATASSIILTTVTDVAGFFSFLGLATVFAPFLDP